MHILVTNDDGIYSPGIRALADQLSLIGHVVVVAPDRERSAVGHSLTLHSPLRAEEIQPGYYSVDGTPTDCVNLGISHLLGTVPDLVVSGINRGGNLGDDISYSGTVAAAKEAALMGVPSIAVSLEKGPFEYRDFEPAAIFTAQLGSRMPQLDLESEIVLNVNVPVAPFRGARLTRQGKRVYEKAVVEKLDPRGRKYYWLGGGELGHEEEEGTDFHAIHSGFVSITPLRLDQTSYRSLEVLSALNFEDF